MFGARGGVGPLSDPAIRDYARQAFQQEFYLDPNAKVQEMQREGDQVRIRYLGLDQQLPSSNVSQFVIVARSIEAREALRERLIALYDSAALGARAAVSRIENGPPVGYPVQYRVSGADSTILRQTASEIASVMRRVPDLSNVNLDWSELSKSIEIEIDQDKARLLGVSSQDIAALLNMSLNGFARP